MEIIHRNFIQARNSGASIKKLCERENISESIKIKTENGFHLKVNVCKFR